MSVVLLIALVVIALLVGRTKDKDGENKVQKSSENVSADSTPQTGPLQDTDPTVTEAPETQPPATEVPTTAPAVVKISGSATHNGLTFTVDQKLSNRFVIKVKNEDACAYSFGWVNPAEIVIETTTSTYFGKVDGWGNTKIEAGSSGQLVVNIQEEIEGDIESITIQNINALNDRNLPVNGSTAGSVVDIYITYNQ